MILFQEKESSYGDAIYTNHTMNTNLLIPKVLAKQYFFIKTLSPTVKFSAKIFRLFLLRVLLSATYNWP